MTRAGLLALLCLLSACEERVELLRGAPTTDANVDAGTNPDAGTGPDAGGGPTCQDCPGGTRCHAGQCVDVTGLRSLSSHFSHTCYLEEGALYCFGRNSAGQLGLETQAHQSQPIRVGTDSDWLWVSVSEESTCGIRAPGRLYCWGNNSHGQLGTGDTDNRTQPTRVNGRDDWLEVACGGWSCCAVSLAAGLHCWGANLEGKPGQADREGAPDVLAPAPVSAVRQPRQLANGQGHVCAIDRDDELHCWGRNSEGQTGVGDRRDQYRAPQAVTGGPRFATVSAGQHHTCGVSTDQALYCWGDNTEGETGIPGLGEVTNAPTQVGDGRDWEAVAVGGFHTCAIKQDGSLHCWGRALEGQLGRVDDVALEVPTPVASALGFRALALGPFHTCAVSDEPSLYCWGANDYGQLGVGDRTPRREPTLVPR